MPRAFGYCRLSPREQVEEGLGMEAQRYDITRYFDYALAPAGYEWARFFEDLGVSGKVWLRSRPEGAKLAAALEPGDAVVFAKLDRGFRDLVDLLTTFDAWSNRGVIFHLLDLKVDTSTDMGRFLLQILGVIAEFERKRISARTKDALAVLRRAGSHTGRAPYGFRVVGPKGKKRLVPYPESRVMGKKIVEWKQKGYTFEAIYWHLVRNKVYQTKGQRKGKEYGLTWIKYLCKYELQLQLKEAEEAAKATLNQQGDKKEIPDGDQA